MAVNGSLGLVEALVGGSAGPKSYDRFRFSRARSRSSVWAISSNALIRVLSSLRSWQVRGFLSARSLARSAAVLTLVPLGVVEAA